MTELTIGIDIGTTSVKALAVDGAGEVVARARVPHEIFSPSADVFEHDADQAWRRGPQRALKDLGVSNARGLVVASLVPSFAAVDHSGRPITPGLLYGDHRGRTAEGGAHDPLNSGEMRAMLTWTRDRAPDARAFWPAAAVAGSALGGEPAVDIGVGVGLAPLWDMEWKADALAEIGLRPDQMPTVVLDTTQPAGRIGDTLQGAGIADAWGEATVAGADSPGDVLVICGTTLIVWAVIEEYREAPGLWTLPHPRGLGFVLSGASNAGGMFVNWVRRTVTVSTVHLDPGGIPLWLPYLRGERTPLHDPARRASLHRLDLSQQPGALVRAAYEASAFSVRRMLELGGAVPRRIVASGGGVHDVEWMQALADCTGLPVDAVAVPEGAALGAAWYARIAAGLDDLAGAGRWVRYGRRYEPDARWEKPCAERYEEWRALAD
jgi:xylulokinase